MGLAVSCAAVQLNFNLQVLLSENQVQMTLKPADGKNERTVFTKFRPTQSLMKSKFRINQIFPISPDFALSGTGERSFPVI